jgi:SAM-dependent methyltransferase
MPSRDLASVRKVLEQPYPDFVAFLGQQNTPPGGLRTIREWIDTSAFNAESQVLDLACSTGWAGRTVNERSGAKITGIDISAPAIVRAQEFADGKDGLTYHIGDACKMPFPAEHFSHVLGGCNFGFIDSRSVALQETWRVTRTGGHLCTASLYYRDEPPTAVLDRVEGAIGYRPDPARTWDYWLEFFGERFAPAKLTHDAIAPIGERAVTRLVRKSVYRRGSPLASAPPEVKAACFHRLRDIRLDLDEHRAYQGLCVGVWTRL